MKYMKLALLALLIPSAILPMERVKNGLKKAAAAGNYPFAWLFRL